MPRRAEEPGPDGLTERQRRVWIAIAEIISETGITPIRNAISQRAEVGHFKCSESLATLKYLGFISREGSRIDVLLWPAGVRPRAALPHGHGANGGELWTVRWIDRMIELIKSGRTYAETAAILTSEGRPTTPNGVSGKMYRLEADGYFEPAPTAERPKPPAPIVFKRTAGLAPHHCRAKGCCYGPGGLPGTRQPGRDLCRHHLLATIPRRDSQYLEVVDSGFGFG